MTLEGVDLASHQREYTYPTNPDFAIIKASGGHDYRNEYLPAQVASARARGIIVGFYHYMFEPSYGTPGNASGGDVAREVDNFIAAVRPYVEPGTTFWLDVEEYPATVGLSDSVLPAWIAAFCDTVGREFGAVCGVYCATWYQTEAGLTGATNLRTYPYWMASWQDAIPDAARMAPWDHLTLHQYDATGIDKDRFYGTREEFLALGVPPTPQEGDVKEPLPDHFTAYINDHGQTIVVANFGGNTQRIDGINVQDLGVSVESATEPGVLLDRSIQANVMQAWHDRRPDAAATEG